MCRPRGHLLCRRRPYRPQPPLLPPQQPVATQSFPLPIKAVSVEAKVADFCASVTIRQKYVNTETDPIEAIYQFELEEKATVSDFVAIVDGNKIKGTIQEKEEAKNTYDDAIASGHGAFMMEEKEEEPNVFTVNVGNLAPGKEADISITYVTELEFDDGQLKFVLPTSKTAHKVDMPPLKLHISYDMTSNIRSMSSPSHPISFEFGDEPNQATVTLTSDSVQSQAVKDFVVLTKLAKPHEACGRVEEEEKGTSKTVMVSIFPNLELADDEDIYTEMIFIVDRSGSMSGSRINQVKDTLQIFLRSLSEGTQFNIIGFGSSTQHLFPKGSVEYNDTNLATATQHVKQMSANLGGTNILRPLQEVLQQKPKEGYPRQLFILTDGEVSNTQECIDYVRKHADTTRVFTFGIGNDASQDLVKGMAKAGEGYFELIRSGEAMEEKVMRQLRRAMQPALTDISVSWKGAAGAHVKPAPFRFAPLFSGGRLVTYGLVEKQHARGEVEVTISAKTAVKAFERTVKVDLDKSAPGHLFSKLAARALLKDLEEKRSFMHDGNGNVKSGHSAKDVVEEAVRVSVGSGVLSKHTAFVAVEERDEATEGTMQVRKIPITFEKAPQPVHLRYQTGAVPLIPSPAPPMCNGGGGQRPFFSKGGPPPSPGRLPPPSVPMFLSSPASSSMSSSYGAPSGPAGGFRSGPPPMMPCPAPMALPPPGSAYPSAGRGASMAPPGAMADFLSYAPPPPPPAAMNDLFGCAALPPPSPMAAAMSSSPALRASKIESASVSKRKCVAQGMPVQQAQMQPRMPMMVMKESEEEEKKLAVPPSDKMREIIRKQKANGSWEWSDVPALVAIPQDKLRAAMPASRLAAVDKEAEQAWATAVVAAYLSTKWPDQKTNWELVVKKAIKFVARAGKALKWKSEDDKADLWQLALAFVASA